MNVDKLEYKRMSHLLSKSFKGSSTACVDCFLNIADDFVDDVDLIVDAKIETGYL